MDALVAISTEGSVVLTEVEARQRLRLHPGETPLLAYQPSIGGCWAQMALTFGLYAIWRARTVFALTDQRVVYKKGIVSKVERSVPLTQIQDATVFSQLWVGGVRLTTAGGADSIERLAPITTAEARVLADRILQEAHQRRAASFTQQPPTPASSQPDPVEQLARLGELRDKGVVSSEEFEAKKAELLGRL